VRDVRPSLALVAAISAVVAGCSSGGDEETEARPTTASTAAATTTATGSGGGFVDRLSELFGRDEVSRCIDEAAEDAPSTSGGKTVSAVARDVERLRGLRLKKLPRPRYLTGRALDRRLARWVEEYPEAEAAADSRILVALGALPPGSDLKELVGRALAGQVAGFYDPRTGELVVDAGDDRTLGGFDRVVLAHELEHALADQALGLPDAVRGDDQPAGREDAALAATAVVEGDATLLMEVYALDHLSFADALRSIAPALASMRDLDALPHVVRSSMLFPYEEGLRFVCALYERGGWRAVDRAYRRLPASSAEIMFPERYGSGERPVDPPDPPRPGGGWRRLDVQALGAADLLTLFEAPGGDEKRALDDARARAGAWAGGEVHAWARGAETAIALGLVDRRPGGRLCDSIKEWRAAARIEAAVRCVGRDVRVGIAPDAGTASRLVSS
jgi:hypothetical protein